MCINLNCSKHAIGKRVTTIRSLFIFWPTLIRHYLHNIPSYFSGRLPHYISVYIHGTRCPWSAAPLTIFLTTHIITLVPVLHTNSGLCSVQIHQSLCLTEGEDLNFLQIHSILTCIILTISHLLKNMNELSAESRLSSNTLGVGSITSCMY